MCSQEKLRVKDEADICQVIAHVKIVPWIEGLGTKAAAGPSTDCGLGTGICEPLLMVTSLSAVASAEGQWRRMVSMGQRHMCQNESPEMAPAEVVALLAGASIVIESLAASGEGSGDSGPAEQPEACEQPWSDAGE